MQFDLLILITLPQNLRLLELFCILYTKLLVLNRLANDRKAASQIVDLNFLPRMNKPLATTSLVNLTTAADLVERSYDAILDAICNGEILAGEKITQEWLAQSLGVSRQPILQALRLLEKDGLIRNTPNKKGVEVIPFDAAFVSHLYTVRSSLDALAAKSAAALPRPDLLEAGIALLRAGKSAIHAGDLQAIVRADIAFHRFIYQASGNRQLVQTGDSQWHQTRRVMTSYLKTPSSYRGIWIEHQAILDAIIKGDARLASKLSKHHALESIDFLFRLDNQTIKES